MPTLHIFIILRSLIPTIIIDLDLDLAHTLPTKWKGSLVSILTLHRSNLVRVLVQVRVLVLVPEARRVQCHLPIPCWLALRFHSNQLVPMKGKVPQRLNTCGPILWNRTRRIGVIGWVTRRCDARGWDVGTDRGAASRVINRARTTACLCWVICCWSGW